MRRFEITSPCVYADRIDSDLDRHDGYLFQTLEQNPYSGRSCPPMIFSNVVFPGSAWDP